GSLRLCKSAVLHFCHNVSPSLGITLTGSLRLCKSAVLHFCHFIAHFSGSFAQKCIIKTIMTIRLWQQLAPGITGLTPGKVQFRQADVGMAAGQAENLPAVFLWT